MQIQQDIQQTHPNYTATYKNYPHHYNNQSHHIKSTPLSSPLAAPAAANHHHIHSCLSKSHDDVDDDPQEQQKEAANAADHTFAPVKETKYKSEPQKEEKRSCSGPRERLKRHRIEVSSSSDGVWIPDIWGQEGFLKDWTDCANFDASLVAATIANARDSLMEESKRIRRSSSSTINNSSTSDYNNNNNNSPTPSRVVLLRVNSST